MAKVRSVRQPRGCTFGARDFDRLAQTWGCACMCKRLLVGSFIPGIASGALTVLSFSALFPPPPQVLHILRHFRRSEAGMC